MSATLIFWMSLVILFGLQLCLSEKVSDANGSYHDWGTEVVWTNSHFLRRFYGVSYLLGYVLVVASVAYLTFVEHWWYILAYLGGLLGAKICAAIFKIAVELIVKPCMKQDRVRICRIIGSLIILITTVVSAILIL